VIISRLLLTFIISVQAHRQSSRGISLHSPSSCRGHRTCSRCSTLIHFRRGPWKLSLLCLRSYYVPSPGAASCSTAVLDVGRSATGVVIVLISAAITTDIHNAALLWTKSRSNTRSKRVYCVVPISFILHVYVIQKCRNKDRRVPPPPFSPTLS
jgi:hypothetical protein